jgi:hypothetical protein
MQQGSEERPPRIPAFKWEWQGAPDRGWRSTLAASRAFILIGAGVLFAIFQLWLVAALAVAVGVFFLLYARRNYPKWRARQR